MDSMYKSYICINDRLRVHTNLSSLTVPNLFNLIAGVHLPCDSRAVQVPQWPFVIQARKSKCQRNLLHRSMWSCLWNRTSIMSKSKNALKIEVFITENFKLLSIGIN